MLETILGKLGLPLLIEIVRGALAKIDNPVAQGAAKALDQTQAAMNTGAITPEAQAEANRHLERMTELAQKERSDVLDSINQTMRTETQSSDVYVRRMRPTFGYLMAVTWAAQMLALAYIIVFDTGRAPVVLQAVESLSTIWGIALSVLGLYVYKRSDEKRPIVLAAPQAEQGGAAQIPVPSRKPFTGGTFNQ
ncbi:MAG: ribokinase [Rhodospirillales bacterium]|nr:ribokinase [Alphaproteobacteria bacterium]MCB9987046.1 ribokinase [Rhodospirillales bacterium]USO08186.1 MAG: ribokinase [Rhodospirillales bacterium]